MLLCLLLTAGLMLLGSGLVATTAVSAAPAGPADPGDAVDAVDENIDVTDPGVDADDPRDRYLIDGGLLLDRSYEGEADPGDSIACDGCSWEVVPLCGSGALFGGLCGEYDVGCPAQAHRYQVRRWSPAEPAWTFVGTMCVGPAGPRTRADVEGEIIDLTARRVPVLSPSSVPAGRTIVGVPTRFTTGQPTQAGPWVIDLFGIPVTLSARVGWEWRFADGMVLRTTEPGIADPGAPVGDNPAHVFDEAGPTVVAVSSVWTATYSIGGGAPLPVPDPVVQDATLDLAVLGGPSVLVAPRG